MKKSLFFLLILFNSCSQDNISPSNTPQSVVESLWQYTDENYAYFDYKNINWVSIKDKYLKQVNENTSKDSLYRVCSNMVSELKDGHCFLENGINTYQYDYSKGYDINFSLDLIKSKYLKNTFEMKGNFTYGIVQDSIGYVHCEVFSRGSFFVEVMQSFKDKKVKKIIIDIRNNGGGDPQMAVDMAGYFVNQDTKIGYIQHKGGKEHNNFSAKIDIKALPKTLYFSEKVNLLINRKSFSASSYFAGMVKNLPNFQLIGQITGGGGGAAAAYELPNKWVVGITSNFFTDSQDKQIENGVSPSIEIVNSSQDIFAQKDKMLEKAIEK
jgi:hypothetical protein